MSFHDPEITQEYRIRCNGNGDSCAFTAKARSAGEAERLALEHIEAFEERNGCPNLMHEVEIQQVTLVGRQL